MNGLVLGAMVAEHALDIGHAPDKPYIEDEDADAQDAVHNVPEQRAFVVFAHDEVRDERRHDNEQRHAQGEPEHHGDHHLGIAENRLLLGRRLGDLGRLRRGSAVVRGRFVT